MLTTNSQLAKPALRTQTPEGTDHLIDGVPPLPMLCIEQLCLRVVSGLDQLEGEVEWLVVVVSSGQFGRV